MCSTLVLRLTGHPSVALIRTRLINREASKEGLCLVPTVRICIYDDLICMAQW